MSAAICGETGEPRMSLRSSGLRLLQFFCDQAIGHNFPDIVLNHFRCLNKDNAE
jgi:hypothetical protein